MSDEPCEMDEEAYPPPTPSLFILERTHVFVTDATRATRLVKGVMVITGGNSVYNHPECKGEGITRDKTLDYRIKLFQTDQDDVFIVELHRRSRTGYHQLEKMFVGLHNMCVAEGILCDKDGTPVTNLRQEPTSVYEHPRLVTPLIG